MLRVRFLLQRIVLRKYGPLLKYTSGKLPTVGDLPDASTITESPTALALIELRAYVAEGPLQTKKDPLEWWKSRQIVYPRLSKLAKKYLCIVATSVPSERIFSKAGQLISVRRNRLKDKNFGKNLFLHCTRN